MRFVRAKRLVDDDVKRKSRWCVSVSVFEYLDAKQRETKSETTKVVLKMRDYVFIPLNCSTCASR